MKTDQVHIEGPVEKLLAVPHRKSLTVEYLIYRDTWVMQYHGKATLWRPLLVAPRELFCGPQGGRGPHLRNPGSIQFIGLQHFWERAT